MYPDRFDYYRPDSVSQAVDLLTEHPGAELIAGGHSLIPTMKSGLSSPESLVDLGGVETLEGIDYGDETITIGAMTTYATVTDDDSLWEDCTVVAEASNAVGDRQVRNCGTLGGNVAHADPASDIPAAALSAGATVHIRGPGGERTVPIEDFFHGMYANDVGDEEILTAIELPRQPTVGGAYAKRPSQSSGYALVGVAVNLPVEDGELTDVRVAANGVLDHAVRLHPVEDRLSGESPDSLSASDLEAVASHAGDEIDDLMIMDDIQASPDFRKHLLEVYTGKALETALDRTGGVTDL